jgi:hypothetical protein
MSKIRNIIKGNIDATMGKTTEFSEQRLKICRECEYASTVFFLHCKICKCRIEAKVLIKEEKCEKRKW